MRDLSMLSFEVSEACNLSARHPLCPSNRPERYPPPKHREPMRNEQIVQITTAFYKQYNFNGFIAWHWYNEPLMDRQRILRLQDQIALEVPDAQFWLWTNGTLLDGKDILHEFERVTVTDYGGCPHIAECVKGLPHVQVQGPNFDDRIHHGEHRTWAVKCRRPYIEFPIDFFGTVHLCCQAWTWDRRVGSIHSMALSELILRFKYDRIRAEQGNWTDTCRGCTNPISDERPYAPRRVRVGT
jgi:hypothetical protein